MNEKNKNQEIHSRREFFKNATKKVLPIIGIILLGNIPTITKANTPMDCEDSCTTFCNYCKNNCEGSCDGKCDTTCYTTCERDCRDGCYKTCDGMNQK